MLSPFGREVAGVCEALAISRAPCSFLSHHDRRPIFPLASSAEELVERVEGGEHDEKLDRVTRLAIASARETLNSSPQYCADIGCVSIGSSRGPTTSLERTIALHASGEGRIPTLTSPSTTAGNISSWVAQECLTSHHGESMSRNVASINTSMTCSSALHSLLVAYSFVRSGMAEVALFGGAEAPLTAYTVAQLEALRIYSTDSGAWPCRPCAAPSEIANWVVLGEGAGTALLCRDDGHREAHDLQLSGVGWAVEEIPSATGISRDGKGFESAMRMALERAGEGISVDGVILHAPGSRRGDEAELRAVGRVFGNVPVCSTKHLTGHTYGASGMVSLQLAQALFAEAIWNGFPYESLGEKRPINKPRTLAINTAGFGGNAITIIVTRCH